LLEDNLVLGSIFFSASPFPGKMNRHRIAYNKLASITPDDEEYYIAYSDDDGDDYDYDDDDDRRWPYYYDEDDDDDDDDDETEEEEETSVAASASAASSSSRHVTWAVQTASSSSSFSQSISSSSSISPSSSSSSAAAATPSKSCRSRSQRQNSNETVAFFVQQTWKLVNEAKTNHFVCWGPTGDSIIIANVERFTKVVSLVDATHHRLLLFLILFAKEARRPLLSVSPTASPVL
jgi:hypothetical protein